MGTSTAENETATATELRKEQVWLRQLVGEWTFECDAPAESDGSGKFSGTETVRAIGDQWVQAEGQGEAPGCGGPATTQMTIGFDPEKDRFVGTWIGSMMAHLWVYDGELDADERVLTLSAEGPSMADPKKMAQYRDVIELKSPDHRTLSSYHLTEDGTWQQFMVGNYYRR